MTERPRSGVLLIIGGGIAAYKALELGRLLVKSGVAVRSILTRAGAEFVTPLSLASLTGGEVRTELFSLTEEQEMGHIELSRASELILVAPATADLMAKLAVGRADDLASTALLATDAPVLMAPAMNVRMWEHPATRRNRIQLEADGVAFVGPEVGLMACGETGPGRMAEPEAILQVVLARLARRSGPLAGRRALVTAGPTREPIDPIRYISNRSSGRQGYAIASALAERGAEVVLVSGPTTLAEPAGVRRVEVETAREMLAACEAALPADVAVMVAAVADYRMRAPALQKLKKGADGPPALELEETDDVLATLSRAGPRRPRLVIGFAAETERLLEHAAEKRRRKGCDWLLANDVTQEGVLGGSTNAVTFFTDAGVEPWPTASKTEVAARLADRVAAALGEPA